MKKVLLGLFLLGGKVVPAQLLQQDFQSSTTLTAYTNATAPNNGQFNSISTSGANTTPSIATSGSNNFLRYNRTGGNAGSFARTTDFSPVPTTLMYRMDITVNGTAAATNAAIFQVGSGFGTANSTESNANTYARLGLNTPANGNAFVIRDVTSGVNSSSLSGTQTVLWVMNNSGTSQRYTSPLGTEATVGNDKADIWAGTTLLFDEVGVQSPTQTITDLKFAYTDGGGTIDLDNFLIDPIPPTTTASAASGISATVFTANWTTVSGVTGYRVDVATAADFSAFVPGYQNVYVSGATTGSLTVTGLNQNTTYYYRVRSASQYGTGEFAGGNSDVQSLTTAATAPLPLTLSGFGGVPASGGVELQWTSLAESGVAGYTLERSVDGRGFAALASIAPLRNDGTGASYTHLDVAPVKGSSYYRLRVTEFNGQVHYSSVFRVLFGVVSSALELYPNPLQNRMLTLQAGSLPKGNYSVRIVSPLGQVVESRLLCHAGGFFTQTLRLAGLQSGVYTLQLNGAGVTVQKQLVVN